ncbi:LytTR family transcriptional regulator DNA-binding domain-containing protein [uncultured Lamprocystis sp.]|nr:LytTR family transcriptional regulator DNA-binding domain-containing protein [uncultured Lamprocystis sp.]
MARSRLSALDKDADGNLEVLLRDCPERLPVSRRHLPEIRRWLRGGAS